MEKSTGIDISDPDPQVTLTMVDDATVKVSIMAFVPTAEAARIEQKALKAGLADLRKMLVA